MTIVEFLSILLKKNNREYMENFLPTKHTNDTKEKTI